ncbi:MAG: 3'(2'),5'-bisphosphate nucleotidase [Rhodospirillaceae bacterium]|nr:3'(2'),5'-bisphosphate nucleotidase [Rhodospirillaceae bacterium]|tara:strand:+ start:31588 stop:32370 length:783 start_codon:yes stop_codon:yes gene_type:complete
MTLSDRAEILSEIIDLADLAGAEIMKIYRGDMQIRQKADESPVTAADEAAEKIILSGLRKLTPNIPVVAEEEAAAGKIVDVGSKPFWLVDPLDGTKEFIAHRDEFTVNIALIENSCPTMGVLLAPAQGVSYAADGPGTAKKRIGDNAPQSITVRPIPTTGVIATASRSHGDKTQMQKLLTDYDIADVVVSGSSIKFCIVACGEADIYPRYGPTSEWDIAAGHAILTAAGGSVCTLDGSEMQYGKPRFRNSEFIAYGGRGE